MSSLEQLVEFCSEYFVDQIAIARIDAANPTTSPSGGIEENHSRTIDAQPIKGFKLSFEWTDIAFLACKLAESIAHRSTRFWRERFE
ncbi:MAG: hypothetical protein H0U99_02000 [Chthoniobacterales bacterium]|nr:hypothetical protein [Chthoniobacterales bacterium]